MNESALSPPVAGWFCFLAFFLSAFFFLSAAVIADLLLGLRLRFLTKGLR